MARGVPITFFPENKVPKSQLARGVALRFFERIKSPNLKSQAVLPEDFLRESSPQLANREGCPPKILSRYSNRKGCFPKIFRESSTQISNRKGCPLRLFRESFPQLSSRLLVLFEVSERRHPHIISLRFRLNSTCGVFRSFSLLLE